MNKGVYRNKYILYIYLCINPVWEPASCSENELELQLVKPAVSFQSCKRPVFLRARGAAD